MGSFAQTLTSLTSIVQIESGRAPLSLTEFATSALSAIASGSAVEVGSAVFFANGDQAINASSWTAISTGGSAYIGLTASGTAGSQLLSAAWVSTAPVWRTDKAGWYASAASSVRVIGGATKNSATSQGLKFLYDTDRAVQCLKRYGDGNLQIIGNIIGALVCASALSVTGAATFTNAASCQSTLNVTGALHGVSTIEAEGGIIAGHGNTALLKKMVNIGDWNMDTTETKNVTHGLTDANIRGVTAVIRNDAATTFVYLPYIDATGSQAAILTWGTGQIGLWRLTGGTFDGATFDSTSYNRGWITIEYEP